MGALALPSEQAQQLDRPAAGAAEPVPHARVELGGLPGRRTGPDHRARWDTSRGTAWRSRVEHYLTNPATDPDPAKWEVDIAYLTAGA